MAIEQISMATEHRPSVASPLSTKEDMIRRWREIDAAFADDAMFDEADQIEIALSRSSLSPAEAIGCTQILAVMMEFKHIDDRDRDLARAIARAFTGEGA